MTVTQQRQNLLSLLEQARSDGATLDHACVQIGLTARQRAALASPGRRPE